MEQRFIPLLLVVLLAFLVPILLARFRRIPVVVGEILAGILIGPSVLGWVHTGDPTLEILAEIGFAFLMFLSGLEIDFSILFAASRTGQDKKKSPILLAGLSFLLTIVFAAGIGFWLTNAGFVKDPWMMTLILSTTSLGIVVPVLKEKKMSSSGLGQTILLSALLADFLTMFLITVYIAVRSSGLSLNILLIGLLFIPVLLLYQFGQRHLRRPLVRRLIEELADANSQIKVRGAFALMIAFVVMAELIGAELILGAFLGGVLASLLSEPNDEKIRHKLDAIGFGFFVLLFFVYVGVRFDLQAFLNNRDAWVLLPMLLAAAFAIKIVSPLSSVLRIRGERRFHVERCYRRGFRSSSRRRRREILSTSRDMCRRTVFGIRAAGVSFPNNWSMSDMISGSFLLSGFCVEFASSNLKAFTVRSLHGLASS